MRAELSGAHFLVSVLMLSLKVICSRFFHSGKTLQNRYKTEWYSNLPNNRVYTAIYFPTFFHATRSY